MRQKIIVILGPTAVWKSDIAVRLSKKFNGEVISADSRQVYRGLNIGTGKITKREMKGVRHHLLDVADPKKQFTVVPYMELARKAIKDIIARGKLPIICGGTGFYISALLGDETIPDVPPDMKLRAQLAKKNAPQLFRILQKLNLKRAKNIDKNNKRRVIRAIEIAKWFRKKKMERRKEPRHWPAETNQWVPTESSLRDQYDILSIGLNIPKDKLRKRITIRLFSRISRGMIGEAKRLHKQGLSWKRMEELGLEYRYLAKYLKNQMTRDEMIKKLDTEIWRYAKRQMTWFKRDKKTKWFTPRDIKAIEKETGKFIE